MDNCSVPLISTVSSASTEKTGALLTSQIICSFRISIQVWISSFWIWCDTYKAFFGPDSKWFFKTWSPDSTRKCNISVKTEPSSFFPRRGSSCWAINKTVDVIDRSLFLFSSIFLWYAVSRTSRIPSCLFFYILKMYGRRRCTDVPLGLSMRFCNFIEFVIFKTRVKNKLSLHTTLN